MASQGSHVTALVRTHASGDEEAFYAVALQAAAREARQGHHHLAANIKKAVESSRGSRRTQLAKVTRLPRSQNDVTDLIEVSYPQVSLRDLVIAPDLAAQVVQVIQEQRQRAVLAEHGFTPMHRLLLEGPPGTGKTMTASVISSELSLPMCTVRLDGLLSKFMGETASKLRTIFETVASQRAVYLFDEFDALGGDRGGNDVGEARRILNTFLMFLEDAGSDSIVIAATNHRSILDRALFRRFDAVLTYSLPDAQQAQSVIRKRLGSLVKGVRLGGLVSFTEGLSHADLVKAAESAAKSALMRGDTAVTRKDIETALSARRLASLR
ncbi:AAA family ATPase [Actinomyces sp. oral taxon 897]|jgi:AAA ATPase central domain protein|uniref:AAA family ATPase n=1 Tax=Actinomyces sp. oral taxon 897 TaxID=2081702 RepID=UPI000D02D218|nr:ATP-binding protein [Actinomyces sp. oral taxon 897]AVM62298.1 AAA family ATPase [Actinomyces sp. oral taxon 897]